MNTQNWNHCAVCGSQTTGAAYCSDFCHRCEGCPDNDGGLCEFGDEAKAILLLDVCPKDEVAVTD